MYYLINKAFEPKEVGCYPQSCKMGCGYNHSRSDSIDQVKTHRIPNFSPFTGCFVLQKKARLTDFISAPIIPTGFIVSAKAKAVLEKHDLGKHIFFQTSISMGGELFNDYYWFIYEPIDLTTSIDFSKTEIFLVDGDRNKIRKL